MLPRPRQACTRDGRERRGGRPQRREANAWTSITPYSFVRFASNETCSWSSSGSPNRVLAGLSCPPCQTMCRVQCAGGVPQKKVSRPRCGWITFVRQGGRGRANDVRRPTGHQDGYNILCRHWREWKRQERAPRKKASGHQTVQRGTRDSGDKASAISDFDCFLLFLFTWSCWWR